MSETYQSLSHSRWDCTYHVVFIPKCRRKILYGEYVLNRPVLRRLLSARAFHRKAMDLGGECLQLSFFHKTYLATGLLQSMKSVH
jgi:hypothetical protein